MTSLHSAVQPFAINLEDKMADEAAQLELKKKRTFRKFMYRGVDLDQGRKLFACWQGPNPALISDFGRSEPDKF